MWSLAFFTEKAGFFMNETYTIAVDAMGGDNAPQAVLDGILKALAVRSDFRILLLGKEDVIDALLKEKNYTGDRIEVVPASEVIEMAESPVHAIKVKKDSSLVKGFHLLKEEKADALLSAGNSGAVAAGGTLLVGRMKGIERAPFGALIPTTKGPALLLDSGANIDAKPSWLVQYARMGDIYMKRVMGMKNPKIGLVNIGAEEEKGNRLVKETMPLLRECSDMNFIGSVEARDIPSGGADVIICDAFVGNVILKMYEGTASAMLHKVKEGLLSSLRSKIGALLIKPALKQTLKAFDVSEYGGAPVLGLKKLVVKVHGSANADEFKNGILQCITFQEENVNGHIRDYLDEQADKEKIDAE